MLTVVHQRVLHALRREGRMASLFASAYRAVQDAPQSADAHQELAECLLAAGDKPAALASAITAVRLSVEAVDCILLRARIHFHLSDWHSAHMQACAATARARATSDFRSMEVARLLAAAALLEYGFAGEAITALADVSSTTVLFVTKMLTSESVEREARARLDRAALVEGSDDVAKTFVRYAGAPD